MDGSIGFPFAQTNRWKGGGKYTLGALPSIPGIHLIHLFFSFIIYTNLSMIDRTPDLIF
jgi:hypothetical protein